MLILGIDDAGRGPVIGPMILAGVLIDDKVQDELKELGVKDSKQLTQKRREFLSEKIKDLAETFEVVLSSPEEIDNSVGTEMNLNKLEAVKCADIINKINQIDKGKTKISVVIDCPSVSIVSWDDFLRTKIKNLSNLSISCEHKADKNHVAVAAASILAKCKREKEMDKLKEKYGDEIGSGYPSDHVTCKFLKEKGQKYKDDGIFRKSWSTWKKVHQNKDQKKLL